MNILLIEDSKTLVESLRAGLTRSGFEVATATNGFASSTGWKRFTSGG